MIFLYILYYLLKINFYNVVWIFIIKILFYKQKIEKLLCHKKFFSIKMYLYNLDCKTW